MSDESESSVFALTQEINESFENVHCDMHNLSMVLADIRALAQKGINTGNAVESLQSQIDDHYMALERYYTQLESLRDEIKAKADEVADCLLVNDAAGCCGEQHTASDTEDDSEVVQSDSIVTTMATEIAANVSDADQNSIDAQPVVEQLSDF